MTPLLLPLPLFRLISRVIWRLPGTPARKMAEFSHVESGSGLDMLAATEAATDPLLRRKYFRHALDELKHARMFRERARILADSHGRAHAVLEDTGFIGDHGIRSDRSLVEQLGETEFLAFVWLHELAGAAQFEVYAELLRQDPDSTRMFEEIARDERFHIAYSRAELDRLAKAGAPVRRVVWTTRGRDLWQSWGRFAASFGDRMAAIWLTLLYFGLVAPFAMIARSRERLPGGLLPAEAIDPPGAYARRPG
ncbi:MAG: ferritin-like domain-containing protein [Pseudomonadota bacterium]|nr:ferritin-like domain-containing protein [Pseudomonadota bacterium]